MFSQELLQENLSRTFSGREILYLSQTDSTNDEAWKCFQEGLAEGALVLTDDQRRGRGRRSTQWFSVPNKSLTFSFFLLPKIEKRKLGILPLLTGVSIVKGIQSSTTVKAGLKWPNDIMLRDKKMGGILIETKSTKQGLVVVIGVGLNINESEFDIPQNIRDQTTSLFIESGKPFQRELILAAVLNEFENLYLNQRDEIIPLWQDQCVHKNRNVSFHLGTRLYEGKFQGITDKGYAAIQINGETKTFSAGVVVL